MLQAMETPAAQGHNHKRCRTCGELKPRDEFIFRPKFGHDGVCRACRGKKFSATVSGWRFLSNGMVICARCRKEKARDAYGANGRSPQGIQSWCLDCWREYRHRKRAANRRKALPVHVRSCADRDADLRAWWFGRAFDRAVTRHIPPATAFLECLEATATAKIPEHIREDFERRGAADVA